MTKIPSYPSLHPMTSGGMKKGQAALEFEEATGKVGAEPQDVETMIFGDRIWWMFFRLEVKQDLIQPPSS